MSRQVEQDFVRRKSRGRSSDKLDSEPEYRHRSMKRIASQDRISRKDTIRHRTEDPDGGQSRDDRENLAKNYEDRRQAEKKHKNNLKRSRVKFSASVCGVEDDVNSLIKQCVRSKSHRDSQERQEQRHTYQELNMKSLKIQNQR